MSAMPRRSSSPGIASKKASRSRRQPHAARPFAPGYGIVGAEEGKGLLPWSWVAGKMNKCRTFWLTTIHAGRRQPHVMPVWGVWLDNAFIFSTGRKSRKGQNLLANPACTVTNDDGHEAVIVEGSASEVTTKPDLNRIMSAYKKKYKIDPRGMNEPIFRVAPTRVFGLIEKTFPQSATRWKLT